MANLYPGVKSGAAGAETVLVPAVAAAAIKVGSIVKYSAAGTGELSARVDNATATNVSCRGVVVSGANRGTYTGSDTNAAAAAGEAVDVATFGRVVIRVDGSTGAIAVGDGLGPSTTANLAIKAAAGSFVIARALQASTGYGDYILAEVCREGIL